MVAIIFLTPNIIPYFNVILYRVEFQLVEGKSHEIFSLGLVPFGVSLSMIQKYPMPI